MNKQNHFAGLITVLFLCLPAQSAGAGPDEQFMIDSSLVAEAMVIADLKADEVRKLKEAGKILPLEDIIKQVREDYPGRIIEIELERKKGRYLYELELVDDNGLVWELEIDAATGQIIKYEQED